MTGYSLMQQARRLIQEERYLDAIACYQQILLHQPSDVLDMHLRLAWCYEQQNMWDESLSFYQKVLAEYQEREEHDAAQALAKKMRSMQKMYIQHQHLYMDRAELLGVFRSIGELIWLEEGEVLCEAGDISDGLWILEAGALGVQLPEYLHDDPDELIAKDQRPVLVGELGVFTRQRRTAKVWAAHPCCLYYVSLTSIEAYTDVRFQAAMYALLVDYWMYPLLSKHSLFERMNDVDRRELCQMFTPVSYQAGSYILRNGDNHDGAYLLQQGCLFFMDVSMDEQTDVIAVSPGDMVHLGGLLHGYHAVYDVKAATDARLLHLSRDDFARFAKKRPWMLQALVRQTRAPVRAQLLHPDDAYLWMSDREIKPRRVRSVDA